MPRYQRHALVPALLIFACTDRLAMDSAGSTGEPTSAAPTTDIPTGTSAPTTSTDTGSTATTSTATTSTVTGSTDTGATDTSTTGTGTTDTSTGLTATETGGSTTGDPPAGCQRCDALVELEGFIIIDPTTDLSEFGCVAKMGRLLITGDLSAEQLAPLCNLRSVTQSLSITQNAVLTDLSSFAGFEKAKELSLFELPALTAVAGMTGLREVQKIDIGSTGAKTLGAFHPEFTGIHTLNIENNAALTDLSALVGWGLKGPNQFIVIRENAALTDLTVLADLFAAAGDGFFFELRDAPALTSLAGLGTASKGHYELSELPLVTNLQPLAGVKTLGALGLRDIPLTSLAGLGALQAAALSLEDMPVLASLDGLGPLTSGAVHLRHLPLLGSLQGLESFATGDLTLIDLPLVSSLGSLGAYTGGAFVQIMDLPLVTSLVGLDKLKSAGWLMIGDCINEGLSGMNGLTDLKGLGSLTDVTEFMVTNSAKLTSLAGVDKLGAVSERLAIINNPKLPKAAFDAFVAKVVEPQMTCFGDWGVCDCIEILSP